MKLKRILAATLAGVMAMTSMAFTVSADGEIEVASVKGIAAKSVTVNYTVSSDAETWEWGYDQAEMIVKTWNNNAVNGDWLQCAIGGANQEQWFQEPKVWLGTYETTGEEITDSFTVNLTEYDVLDELAVLYKTTYYDLTINSIKAYSGANGTGDVTWEYPAPTTYTITCSASESGSVTADKETAAEGETVTLTATPNDGYELESITVNGEAITGTTFEMPAADVKVVAVFTAVEVDEDAPKFDKDAEDFVTDGDVVTQTKTVDGKTSYRFVKKISKETAEKYTKATITIKDTANNFTADPIDIDYCYSSITASGEKISETDCYFIAYTVTEVPESAELEATIELA